MTQQTSNTKNSKTQLEKKAKLAEALRQNLMRRKSKKGSKNEREAAD